MQAAEQQNGDAQESGSTQEGSTQEGSNGQQRWDARQPDGMPQGGMQGMQFDSGMPMLDGGQLPMDGDAERPGGEMMPPNGEVLEGEMPEGERPDLPEGEEPGFASGERPELPTDLNGDPNAQPTAPDGTMTQPPAKPEGDLAPELPEGEEPKLTGERPELPADADAKDDEASSATANAEKKTEKSTEKNSSKSTEKDAQANADAASGAKDQQRGAHAGQLVYATNGRLLPKHVRLVQRHGALNASRDQAFNDVSVRRGMANCHPPHALAPLQASCRVVHGLVLVHLRVGKSLQYLELT